MNVLTSITVLGFLIFFHELGHFLAAILQGIYVDGFSIGVGPSIIQKKYKDITYSFRAFPLGGFVSFPDEEINNIDPKDPNLLKNRPIIQRVIVSTYQSVSGAGQLAMEELKLLTEQYLQGNPQRSDVLPYSLAFNLFLHNSPMLSNNYCEEEMKMVHETRKILNIADLRLSATCGRVPVLRAHSESINIEFAGVVEPKDALEELKKSAGIEIIEDYKNNRFPMPNDVMGRDNVAVGRLRTDISQPNGLELWLCGDQIRKGAALNAVQIAELLIPKK